jgi:hypothetical protein
MQHLSLLNEFKPWSQLSDGERASFFVGPDYLPLCDSHSERISALRGIKAVEFSKAILRDVPGYSVTSRPQFPQERDWCFHDEWNSEEGIQKTREWLHDLGVPYATRIFLIYHELVVQTEWKILVRYWDAFASNVGVAMLALDTTKSWVCCFHHEGFITFSK